MPGGIAKPRLGCSARASNGCSDCIGSRDGWDAAKEKDCARVLGRLDSLSLPSFTDAQVAELARALDLDEDAVADAVRRDLAEALSGPAA